MRQIALGSGPTRNAAPPTAAGNDLGRAATPATQARLIAYVVGVALLVAASVGTMASQSDKFVGIHEVPPFVCDRVELVAGLAVDRSGGNVGPGRTERIAPDDVSVPGSRNAICVRGIVHSRFP